MGPGIDPHLYRASAGDVKTISSADLILYNGLHLESKLISIFEKIGKEKPTKAITGTIPKHQLIQPEEYEGFYDPTFGLTFHYGNWAPKRYFVHWYRWTQRIKPLTK